jgi:hypothetical protein
VTEALADTEAGLRRGPDTLRADARARLLYNAARVYSQASSRLSHPAAGQRPDVRTAYDSEGRAVDLLQRALAAMPAGERAAFWRDYVQVDTAFTPIRGNAAMIRVADEVGRANR